MAHYASLYIKERLVRSVTEDIDQFMMMIFLAEDQRVYDVYEVDDLEEHQQRHVFCASARVLLERLNVLGFTDARMKADFLDFTLERIDEMSFLIERDDFESDNHIKERQFWRKNGLDEVLAGLGELANSNRDHLEVVAVDEIFNSVKNFLMEHDYDLFGALPFYHELNCVRAFLSAVEPEDLLFFDYTDLYEANYFSDQDMKKIFSYKESIVLLTEGSSDIDVLKPALEFLFPHLSPYYSFFDFASFNAQGGSGNLVNMVKSFAGAGISNKIIALFDNDTAAREAQQSLKGLVLPEHIVVRNYPLLDLVKDYPTLGPSGMHRMDINGLACSIELYLGKEVLLDKEAGLFPVFWKGYSPKMKCYQGEVMEKKEIRDRFLEKMAICQKDFARADQYDWSGLVAIFEMLFDGFNEQKHAYRSILDDPELAKLFYVIPTDGSNAANSW